MTRPASHRFPLAPLRDAYERQGRLPGQIHAALGITKRTLYKWRERGLSDRQADHAAVALGLHPSNVWHDWPDVVLDDVARLFAQIRREMEAA